MSIRMLANKKKKKAIILLISGIVIMITTFSVRQVLGLRSMNQRDYLTDRRERFHGRGVSVGEGYTISAKDTIWPNQVTFLMKKDRGLHIKIQTEVRASGVLMLASQISSPRLLKPICTWDEIREPIIFWTDYYWVPPKKYDYSGYPKIRFQAIRGTLDIIIIGNKKY